LGLWPNNIIGRGSSRIRNAKKIRPGVPRRLERTWERGGGGAPWLAHPPKLGVFLK